MVHLMKKLLGAASLCFLLDRVCGATTPTPVVSTVHTTETRLTLVEIPLDAAKAPETTLATSTSTTATTFGSNKAWPSDHPVFTTLSNATFASRANSGLNKRFPKQHNLGDDCLMWPGPGIVGQVYPCWCYMDGYGIDRHWAVDAISAACREFSTLEFGPGKLSQYDFWYFYPKTSPVTSGEESIIMLELAWVDDVGDASSKCAGHAPIKVDYNSCIWGMLYMLLDKCNTEGENGKQGGYGVDFCLMWTVDPNPVVNHPGVPIPQCTDAAGQIPADKTCR